MIDTDGKQVGVVPTLEAIERARQKELDLVLIAPDERPPVARIVNFGKFKYELGKRQREMRRGQRGGTVKELKFTPKINEHDYLVRLEQAVGFLKKGHKVKITMRFRGREVVHPEIGRRILQRLLSDVAAAGKSESPPRVEGKSLILMLTAK